MSIDPAFKREQFRELKRQNDNGELVPAKRKKLSQKTRTAVLARQDGLCGACEGPITGRFDVDHIQEHDLMGSDELSNLVALHVECHRPKTSARAPVLAKVHRLFKDTWEEPAETKAPKLQSRNEWPKGQKIAQRANPWGYRT